MKKSHLALLSAVLLGAAFLVPSLSAMHHGGPAAQRARAAKHLANHLELTDAQKTQLKQLYRAHRNAMEALVDNENLTRKEFREQTAALRKSFQEQRRAVLTPEQQKKADEIRERMQERRGERRPPGRGGPGGRHGGGHGPGGYGPGGDAGEDDGPSERL